MHQVLIFARFPCRVCLHVRSATGLGTHGRTRRAAAAAAAAAAVPPQPAPPHPAPVLPHPAPPHPNPAQPIPSAKVVTSIEASGGHNLDRQAEQAVLAGCVTFILFVETLTQPQFIELLLLRLSKVHSLQFQLTLPFR